MNNSEQEGGVKYDEGKPDFTYISYELLEEVSKVRAFGASKYSRGNWKKGFKVTRSLAACLRHIYTFLSGETNDKESGLNHLAHAVCCLEHALYDLKHHPKNDDRFIIDKSLENKEFSVYRKCTSTGYYWSQLAKDTWRDETSGLIWLPMETGSYIYQQAELSQNDSKRLPTKEEFKEAEKRGIREIICMKGMWFWSASGYPGYPTRVYTFSGTNGIIMDNNYNDGSNILYISR